MKNIERLGQRYCKCEKYLGFWNKQELEKNWWEALKFFFSHSFMRGRRDELSDDYCSFAISALENYFKIHNQALDKSYDNLKRQKKYFNSKFILSFKDSKKLGRKNSVRHENFQKEVVDKNKIVETLVTKNEKEIFLGNDADIMMVLDVLNLISSSDNKKNIYNYIKNQIEKDGAEGVYEELCEEIRYIGDKIATFIIRDVGLINVGLVKESDYQRAFPVDTWVKKIAPKLGYQGETEDSERVSTHFIEKCKENRINPLKFAAGLWYLGSNSLDILLEDCLQILKS